MLKRTGWVNLALIAISVLSGCASDDSKRDESAQMGTVALPLTTYGPSGARYQLRNASFQIFPQSYYYGVGGYATTTTWASAGTAVAAGGSGATSSTSPTPIIINSDIDPDAPSIEVDLEQGSYRIHLLPGWYLDRIDDGVATTVEAQLLSGEWQWAYVSPRSTSWVTYQFGIGGRSVWFNGKLNVDMQVYEDPDDYYGPSYGGYGGMGGSSGAPAGGAVSVGGSVSEGGWAGI